MTAHGDRSPVAAYVAQLWDEDQLENPIKNEDDPMLKIVYTPPCCPNKEANPNPTAASDVQMWWPLTEYAAMVFFSKALKEPLTTCFAA